MSKYDNLINYDDVSTELDTILLKLEKLDELVVLKNNRPVFVIKSIAEEQRNIEQQIEYLLQKIGKRMFIEYYEIFLEDDKPESKLPGKFSMNSRRSRSSAARKIFANHWEDEALKLVLNSSRLSNDITTKALSLVSLKSTESQSVKIGYMIKNVMPLLINDGLLDERLNDLLDKHYCKNTFGIYYPMLLQLDFVFDAKSMKYDKNKYPRYYANPISYQGKDYLLCSQWNEKLHLKRLEDWLLGVLDLNTIDRDKYSRFITKSLRKRLVI